MNDEELDEEQIGEEQYEEFSQFLRQAVNEALRLADGEAFLAWMQAEAPRLLPGLFEQLPDDQARRGFATEFGRSLWNSVPLPDNGFRPRPIARPERNDACPCGSGKKYKKCCAEWAEGAPALDAEGVWMLVAEELPLEQVEAMGVSGRVPRPILGDVATGLLDNGDAARALALVRPLFERPERLDERDSAALNTLLEAYEALDLQEERWEEAERLARDLRPPLRAVLWENLARTYAVEGEMEEAWVSLDRARQDDPESPALGPLEVSLLLAEGRTAEAAEKARYWRGKLKEGDLSEQGFEFLARVGENAEETQLRFSFGDEVTDRIHQLEAWLARAEPPAALYGIEAVADDPEAGRLIPSASLREVEADFEAAFYPPLADPEAEEEEDEDWDPWDEDRAERWLAGPGGESGGPRQRRHPGRRGPCHVRARRGPLCLPGPAAAATAPRARPRHRAAGARRPPRDHPPAQRARAQRLRAGPGRRRHRPGAPPRRDGTRPGAARLAARAGAAQPGGRGGGGRERLAIRELLFSAP